MLPYTRREFTKLALAALPAAGLLTTLTRLSAAETAAKPAAKPNSKVSGVQIGLNVPYSFSNPAMDGDAVLAACLQLGVSGLELRAQPVEMFLGATPDLLGIRRAAANGESAGNARPPADPAAAKNRAEELRKLRTSASMARVREFRKKYEDAGVLIEIVKFDNIFRFVDDELDYAFSMAKALGARAISCEISPKEEDLKRLGSFADKHQFWIGYHGHTKTGPEHWEAAFALAKFNGANVDIGHFVAGWNKSPVEFIKQRHERITHVHIKDKKMNEGANTVFGQGDTPIVEVLRLLRDNKWPIQATIEFEYKVPEGSTRMAEIAKSIQYCRDALAT